MGDIRWIVIAVLILVLWRTRISFRLPSGQRQIPVVVGLAAVGFAIWIAENIGTRCGAWRYPYQEHAWRCVDLGKISSWFLLVMITFLIVAELKRFPTRPSVETRRSRKEAPPMLPLTALTAATAPAAADPSRST